MTHISPAANLSWAIYSSVFECFLLYHLYQYDRFQCLKWNSTNQPGAFKRLMTYTYLSTVPLLILYSVSMSTIKYQEGLIFLPLVGVVPKPFELWSSAAQNWVTPLYFAFGIGWALEMVTHLEELNFWMFLLHQGAVPRAWFTSLEFKTWLCGSVAALTAMPLVVAITRHNPLRCEAWIFFSGSIGSTAITIMFLYVLVRFPTFLERIRNDGADALVIARLTSFHRLNILRVLFRFLFTLPLFVLSMDGIRAHAHPLNESSFWTDLFVMISGLSCIISSGITLLIFFPRTSEGDAVAQQQQQQKLFQTTYPNNDEYADHTTDPFDPPRRSSPLRDSSQDSDATVGDKDHRSRNLYPRRHDQMDDGNPFEPVRNRRPSIGIGAPYFTEPGNVKSGGGNPNQLDIELGSYEQPEVRGSRFSIPGEGPARNSQRQSQRQSLPLHPYISNFTSPIDLATTSLKDDDYPHAV